MTSVAAYREVTRTKCYSFIKPPSFTRIVRDTVGIGLLFIEGDEHKAQRRALNGGFSCGSPAAGRHLHTHPTSPGC